MNDNKSYHVGQWLLRRTFLLYLAWGLILYVVIDHRLVAKATLDYLQGTQNYVVLYANDDEPFDPVQFRQAIRYYRNLQRLHRRSPEIPNALGYCYFQFGQYQKAASCFERAIAFNPDYFGFYYNLGITQYRLRNYQKAREAFLKAVKIPLSSVSSFAGAAIPFERELLSQIKDRKARRMTAVKKSYESAYLYLMNCYLALENYRSILSILQSALATSVDQEAQFYFYGGVASYHLKKFNDAVSLFGLFLERQPGHPLGVYYLKESQQKAMGKSSAADTIMPGAGKEREILLEADLPQRLYFYPPITMPTADGKFQKDKMKI